jgi:putative transposase
VSVRYEHIDAERESMPAPGERANTVAEMCDWLGVSTSGYYEWRSRPVSAAAQRRDRLKFLIQKAFDESDETYGHRRVHAQLLRWGEPCTTELVRSLMRELGLEPCQPRPWRHSLTDADPAAGPIPDLVRRDFTASAPGVKMVGDITYIPTWEGWLYLATVIDCHTKEVIGWAMDDHYRTPLIEEAIRMAARNHDIQPEAIFHSDRGSNYTSRQFAGTLRALGIRQSVGRTGICYDNAMLRPESWSRLAGGSPVRVGTGVPGSRSRFVVETRRAERDVKSPFGGSKHAGRSIKRTLQPRQIYSGEAEPLMSGRRPCLGGPVPGSALGVLPGYGGRHVCIVWAGTGETRLTMPDVGQETGRISRW